MSSNSSSLEPTEAVSTSALPDITSTTPATLPETVPAPELRFIFVPLTVIIIILLMTFMIFSFIRKKRVDRLRHHLMPLYNFAPGEDEADWEAELLEESGDRRGYKSMDYPHSETTELCGPSR